MSETFFRRFSPSTVRDIAKALSISLRNKSEEDIFELVVLHYMEDNSNFWSKLNLKVLCSIAQDVGLPLMGGEESEAISYMIQNMISSESSEDEEEFQPESLIQDEEDGEELDTKLDSAIGLEVDDLTQHEQENASAEQEKAKSKSIEETGGKNFSMSLKANLRKLRGRSEEGRAIKDKVIKIIQDISSEVEGNVDIFTDGYYYETYEIRIPGSKIRFFFLAKKHNEAPVKIRAFSVSELGENVGDPKAELTIDTFETMNDETIKNWIEERINHFAEEGLKIMV